jgi:hypothetical protein
MIKFLRQILEGVEAIQASAATTAKNSDAIAKDTQQIAVDVSAIRTILETEPAPKIVGIDIKPGTPTPRITKEDMDMAGKVTVKLTKKGVGQGQRVAAKFDAKDHAALASFSMQDNNDDTYTVQGVDTAGFPVDISAVATLTPAPTSADPTVLTVDPPTAMTFPVHGIKPGESDVTATATWNDGSLGPFTFTLPTTVTAGPAGGIVVTPGVPTVR